MTDQDLALDWDGRRYLLWRTPGGFGHYRYDSLLGQEVQARPAGDLPDGWQARSDPETNWQYRSWLLVNDSYSVRLTLGEESPLFTLTQAGGVDGFLVVENGEFNFIQDPETGLDRAGMYLGYTRDINDLFVETREGEEWLLWGSNLYRPLWTVPELVDRWNRVEIGDDGLGEWRKVSSVEAVSIAGASIWYLFNEDLSELSWGQGDGITKTFDGGDNYLLVQGKAGQLIRVRFGGALGLVHKHKRVPIRRRPSRRSFMHSTWNRWR